MATPAEPPFLIFQQVSPGNQFTKVDPDAGAERDGVIWRYPNRNKGGRFIFSNNLFFQIRRIVFDFADASSWSIGTRHKHSDDVETLVQSGSKQVVRFTISGDLDGAYVITINGTSYTYNSVGLTVDQIAAELRALVDADSSVVATILVAPDDDTIEVSAAVAGQEFLYSSSSTGDAIIETLVSENSGTAGPGGSSLQRLDLVRELAPGESIVVETFGATQAIFVETLAYPSLSNSTQSFG